MHESKKRRAKFQYPRKRFTIPRPHSPHFQGDFLALLFGLAKIRINLAYRIATIKDHRVLIVEVKASVVQIDRAADRTILICEKIFRMDKSRKIFEYPHPFRKKATIILLGHSMNVPFIIASRRINPYIHTTSRHTTERFTHRSIKNQIRR